VQIKLDNLNKIDKKVNELVEDI